MLTWAYGVTTVPSRRDELLPNTLQSLKAGGFGEPRLFVDGWSAIRDGDYKEFGLETTFRAEPALSIVGNWILGLWELYVRNPQADRYAMFQDDFVTYRNLRKYLDFCWYPDQAECRQPGYLNLYTFRSNEKRAPKGYTGWFLSNQLGKGAVGLVFNREAVIRLLSSDHLARKPTAAGRAGLKGIDGGIITSFRKMDWFEYVHTPSLTQHTGHVSSLRNPAHQPAPNFRGEDFDAFELFGEGAKRCGE